MDTFKNILTLAIKFIFNRNNKNTQQVYTIGDYDPSLLEQGKIIKLGPIPKEEIPDVFPQSFLEKDGCYGGGEAFATIERASDAIVEQKMNGILPLGNWRVYLLQTRWDGDVYQLKSEDYRINKSVRVLQEVVPHNPRIGT